MNQTVSYYDEYAKDYCATTTDGRFFTEDAFGCIPGDEIGMPGLAGRGLRQLSMDERGSASVTAMLPRTLCVNSALRRVSIQRPRRYTTSCRSLREERTTAPTSSLSASRAMRGFTRSAATGGTTIKQSAIEFCRLLCCYFLKISECVPVSTSVSVRISFSIR